MVAKV
jgi:hypothetical protein